MKQLNQAFAQEEHPRQMLQRFVLRSTGAHHRRESEVRRPSVHADFSRRGAAQGRKLQASRRPRNSSQHHLELNDSDFGKD